MDEREDVYFVDHNFLASMPLDSNNILDYFSTSPFYDKSCNNEILKMQTQFRGLDLKSKLKGMIGMFYDVNYINEENTLFVIRKAYNYGNTEETIGIYYSIHGHIYSAPTNYSIYKCRISDLMYSLNTFIDKLVEKKKFNPFNLAGIKNKIAEKEEDKNKLEFMMEVLEDFKKNIKNTNSE